MREVKVAFVAPGQGVDDWSSGLRLLETEPGIVEPIYERIKRTTGVDIEDVGTRNELDIPTEIAQPAAVGIGYAHFKVLEAQGIRPDYAIGLSAGEFTVAAIIGSMVVEKAAIYSMRRGVSQNREAGGQGGVVIAIHRKPLDLGAIKKSAKHTYRSNVHNPIMSGFGFLNKDKGQLVEALEAQGARVKDVESLTFPPHGRYVRQTRRELSRMLKPRTLKAAEIDMISIRNGKIINKPRQIRRSLVWQTTKTTRLDKAIQTAIDNGVEEVYPLMPGDTIAPLLGWYASKNFIKLMTSTE